MLTHDYCHHLAVLGYDCISQAPNLHSPCGLRLQLSTRLPPPLAFIPGGYYWLYTPAGRLLTSFLEISLIVIGF